MLDMNFNFKTEGYLRVIRALKDFNLFGMSLMCLILRRLPTSEVKRTRRCFLRIAIRHRDFRRYFEAQAMDVAIIDVPLEWSLAIIQNSCDGRRVRGERGTSQFLRSLVYDDERHFCAAIPNFRIMEIDIDDVPWRDDL